MAAERRIFLRAASGHAAAPPGNVMNSRASFNNLVGDSEQVRRNAQPQGTGFQDSRLRLGCARTGSPEVAAEGPVRVKLGGASSV
jgi:hypothetical protein